MLVILLYFDEIDFLRFNHPPRHRPIAEPKIVVGSGTTSYSPSTNSVGWGVRPPLFSVVTQDGEILRQGTQGKPSKLIVVAN